MKFTLVIAGILLITKGFAQFEQPKLLFREDWTIIPPFEQVSQKDVMNPDLIQKLYGPGQDSIKKRHHYTDNDPYYIFSGFCPGNWALTLAHKKYFADLTGNATIRCRMMNSGYRVLHIIVKLADGKCLVSDLAEGSSSAWQVHDFIIKDIRWSALDIKTVTEGDRVDLPDLRRVDEIGFTDLMNGGHSTACSRVDWIEVYAEAVKR
jgi:hypothetical protein